MRRYSLRKLFMLASTVAGLASNSAFGVAIVDTAELTVNFTDFAFTTLTGEPIGFDLVPDPSTASSFHIVEEAEIGSAMASVSGMAGACNLAECGIISIFPLHIEANARAEPDGLARAVGSAEGELTFTNDTGMDLMFRVFLESDVSWDLIQIDDPLEESATLSWETGFEYDGVSDSPHVNLLEGTIGGLAVLDVCPGFPSECNARVDLGPFPLASGETRTFRGFAVLAATAISGEAVTVPEPNTLSLLSGLLVVILWLSGGSARWTTLGKVPGGRNNRP